MAAVAGILEHKSSPRAIRAALAELRGRLAALPEADAHQMHLGMGTLLASRSA